MADGAGRRGVEAARPNPVRSQPRSTPAFLRRNDLPKRSGLRYEIASIQRLPAVLPGRVPRFLEAGAHEAGIGGNGRSHRSTVSPAAQNASASVVRSKVRQFAPAPCVRIRPSVPGRTGRCKNPRTGAFLLDVSMNSSKSCIIPRRMNWKSSRFPEKQIPVSTEIRSRRNGSGDDPSCLYLHSGCSVGNSIDDPNRCRRPGACPYQAGFDLRCA